MKMLQKICFVLLLTTFSSAYGGDCIKDFDVDDCRVKAEQGDYLAQGMLGALYYNGQGVLQDYREASKWFKKSAEQGKGNFVAQHFLGLMYFAGKGVIQDYVMAHMYWNLASSYGYEDAITMKGIVETNMTSSQIAEAQKLAREWMRTHQ